MDTRNLSLDTIAFLRKTLKDMRGDISYAYPKNAFGKGLYDSENGHTALQMVSSKIETLNNFLDAIQTGSEEIKAGGTE